jgi:hypothetical protein
LKLSVIDDFLVKSLWGGAPCGYSYQASVGASGGLVTIWDTSVVEVWCTFRHTLVIEGRVITTGLLLQMFMLLVIRRPNKICGIAFLILFLMLVTQTYTFVVILIQFDRKQRGRVELRCLDNWIQIILTISLMAAS